MIANAIKTALESQSVVRKMFEEGKRLKALHGETAVFDFSLGNPDVPPPPAFYDAVRALLQEERALPHGYMTNAGFPDVRAKIAEKAGREHKVTLNENHIVMSVGAAGALNTVLKAILNPGDEVVVSAPYFLEYRVYVANAGGVLREAESGENFALSADNIAKKLTPKTKAVLVNSPHNPTGRVYTEGEIASLSRVLQAHGSKTGVYPYLIADEPYRELVYDGKTAAPVLSAYSESIVVTSYSKNLSLPGERIGYIALSPTLQDAGEMHAALSYATRALGFVNAPALMQRVVARLIDEAAPVEIYKRRRDVFKGVLDRAGLKYAEPEGAFYMFCKTPYDDVAFADKLKENLILGAPGSAFGAPGWIRFAYCVHEDIIAASEGAFKNAMKA